MSIPAAVAANRATANGLRQPSPHQVRSTVTAVAKRHKVDPVLALGVAYTESHFRQGAVSYANAIGAMQVLPSTGSWVASTMAGRDLNLFHLEDNATAGVLYLRYLLDRLPPDFAIGAYLQGPGSVRRYGLTSASRTYVAKVRAHMELFR
jgi:soluble lytic murein transglycosylase-like protein